VNYTVIKPIVQGLNGVTPVRHKHPNQMGKNRLPYAKFKFMHEIDDEHGKDARTVF
jgi:hypothetical protein